MKTVIGNLGITRFFETLMGLTNNCRVTSNANPMKDNVRRQSGKIIEVVMPDFRRKVEGSAWDNSLASCYTITF